MEQERCSHLSQQVSGRSIAVAPAASTSGSRVSFLDVLTASIRRENTTRAWCEACHTYQLVTQARYLRNLPCVFSINAAVVLDDEMEYWRHDGMWTGFGI